MDVVGVGLCVGAEGAGSAAASGISVCASIAGWGLAYGDAEIESGLEEGEEGEEVITFSDAINSCQITQSSGQVGDADDDGVYIRAVSSMASRRISAPDAPKCLERTFPKIERRFLYCSKTSSCGPHGAALKRNLLLTIQSFCTCGCGVE